jgi:hypothetical protein
MGAVQQRHNSLNQQLFAAEYTLLHQATACSSQIWKLLLYVMWVNLKTE